MPIECNKGTIKDTHMLDYMDALKVGECMIAQTRIFNGKMRKFVVIRVKSTT